MTLMLHHNPGCIKSLFLRSGEQGSPGEQEQFWDALVVRTVHSFPVVLMLTLLLAKWHRDVAPAVVFGSFWTCAVPASRKVCPARPGQQQEVLYLVRLAPSLPCSGRCNPSDSS